MDSPDARPDTPRLTAAQVAAAFDTLGIAPAVDPAHIAIVVGSQLRAAEPAFSRLPFDAEPAGFAWPCRQEASS